jgi:hypothetical protein
MEPMHLTVLSVRTVNGRVRAVVRAVSPESANIHLVLSFPDTDRRNVWEAARDEALKYLDIA